MNSISDTKLISKAGKVSFERYKILKERDKILQQTSGKKTLSLKSSPKKKKKRLLLDILKSLAGQENKEKCAPDIKIIEEDSIRSKLHKCDSSKILRSKDSSQEMILNLNNYYTPSYKAQDKHIPTIKFNHKHSQSRKKSEKAITFHKQSLNNNDERIDTSRHVPSCIPFQKQLPRDMT